MRTGRDRDAPRRIARPFGRQAPFAAARRHCLLRDRLRHLEFGGRHARRAAQCAWSSSSRISTMPTAVFYPAKARRPGCRARACEFGRAAVAAYVDGLDGRLMRSMKSILGSSLIEQTTDVGGGRAVRYLDIVAGYLRHLTCAGGRGRRRADRARGARPAGVLRRRRSGARRRRRSRRCEAAASQRRVSRDRSFQYEPIAAAFDYERGRGRADRAGRRHRRRHIGLLARPGRARSARSGRTARATSWPTTASTSPAPTSTAASSSPASCRELGYGALGPSIARRAAARGAERGLLRPRDLAPDQHRLQPAARRRAAQMRGFYADPSTTRA